MIPSKLLPIHEFNLMNLNFCLNNKIEGLQNLIHMHLSITKYEYRNISTKCYYKQMSLFITYIYLYSHTFIGFTCIELHHRS